MNTKQNSSDYSVLHDALQTLKKSTVPLNEHIDPMMIDLLWEGVFEKLERLRKSPASPYFLDNNNE